MSTRDTLIKLIVKGDPIAFHAVCNETDEADLDISGATFRKLRLGGYDFSNFNLATTEWEECDFSGVRFDHANLSNSYLHSCSLFDIHAEATNFEGAALENCILKRTVLSNCDFTASEFSNNQHAECTLISGTYNEIDWSGLTFDKGNWLKISEVDGELRAIQLRDVELDEIDLSGATVTRCFHQRCVLNNVEFPDGFKVRSGKRRTV